MKTTQTIALAAALTLTALGSQAFAGEGSPDLSNNYPAANESDPGGSNYGNTYGRFSEPYYTRPRAMYRGYATPREDENTGSIVRQNRYEEDDGIDGE